MDIAEVVRRSGIAASALRFYEERGLIASVGRRGLRRQYAPEVLDRLALVTLGRAAGLSLDEIGTMLAEAGGPRVDRGVLTARADELDRQIRRLETMRDGLRHAAACSAPDHFQCPKFRRLMGLAMSHSASRPPDGRGGSRRAPGRSRGRAH